MALGGDFGGNRTRKPLVVQRGARVNERLAEEVRVGPSKGRRGTVSPFGVN